MDTLKQYSEQEARARLIDAINAMNAAGGQKGGQKAFAAKYRFTPGYVHDVIHGNRPMAYRIARAIGLMRETIVVYREIEDND